MESGISIMGKDPVKHCDLYKNDGCAHVDGYLCDFETCSMRLDYALRVHTEGGYEIGSVEEAEEFSRKRNYPPGKKSGSH